MAHTASLILACVFGSAAILAQQPSPLAPQPDGSIAAQAAGSETVISPVQFAKNVLRDQKPIWAFPERAVRGKHWKPALAVALGTATLVQQSGYRISSPLVWSVTWVLIICLPLMTRLATKSRKA